MTLSKNIASGQLHIVIVLMLRYEPYFIFTYAKSLMTWCFCCEVRVSYPLLEQKLQLLLTDPGTPLDF